MRSGSEGSINSDGDSQDDGEPLDEEDDEFA